jgi:RNA polymerase sigma factor (sigma-70 family)
LTEPPFCERPDAELRALSDERLIEYIRSAHVAERAAAQKRALGILVFGHWDRIRYRVLLKIPEADVEDVTGAVVTSAMTTVFRGESVGEFRALLNRIVSRRIADFHRSREGNPRIDPLPGGGEEAGSAEEPAVEPETGAVEVGMVTDDLLEELNAAHRRVVELHVIESRPAAEAARAVADMTEANVHQIASRFRRSLREALYEGDTEGMSP